MDRCTLLGGYVVRSCGRGGGVGMGKLGDIRETKGLFTWRWGIPDR